MQVLDGEGVAIHTGPESCMVASNCGREALTGGDVGQVLSRESRFSGVPTLSSERKAILAGREREFRSGPTRSETLRMRPRTSHGNREVLGLATAGDGAVVRSGNLQDHGGRR